MHAVNLGPAEILVVLVVGLLVMGPQKLPEAGRQVARGLAQFRNLQATLREEIAGGVPDPERVPNDPPSAGDGGTFT